MYRERERDTHTHTDTDYPYQDCLTQDFREIPTGHENSIP